MELVHTVSWMKQIGGKALREDRVLGLVPTMGALHEGHLSLVREAKRCCSPVVVSIFVNPKQFGPSEDFSKYPRALGADRVALEQLGVDYLFAPPAEEIYPQGFRTSVFVDGLSDVLEGRSRPGHFRGVATVVLKLFEIVQPRRAFFGRKDAQQVRIIKQMVADLDLGTDIVVRPIVREPDGLALSSRNAYLKPEGRRAATVLHRALAAASREIASGELKAGHLLSMIQRTIATEPLVALDYAEIVDVDTLEPVMALRKNCYVLLAARVGGTRLIDNALVEQTGDAFRVTI